jgi:branched-chain amino acid transport system substrate-binding protein
MPRKLQHYVFFAISILTFVPGLVTAAEPFKIAIILPLTGQAATWGEDVRNGVMFALSRMSEQDKKLIEIHFEDDQFKSSSTVSAFKKLQQIQKPDLYVVFGSQAAEVLAPLTEKYQIPLIVITASQNVAAGKKYVLRHWLGSDPQSKILIPEVLKRAGKRIAIVKTTYSAMLDFADNFKQNAEGKAQIVYEDDFPPVETDFKTTVSTVLSKKPDALLCALLPGQLASFMRQLRSVDPSLLVFGYTQLESREEMIASQGAMNGILYAGPTLTKECLEKYEEQHHTLFQAVAAGGNDIVMLVVEALKHGASNREEVNTYLHQVQAFNGCLGTYGVTSDNFFDMRATLKTIKNDEFKFLSELEK